MPPINLIPETAWFPVFRSGSNTDASGNTRYWSEQDIDTIIDVNKGRLADVKAVLGHPKTDDPAYGETGGLKKIVKDGVVYLYAQLKNAVQEFGDMVNAGMYNRVSIALYPDLRLRHIGFLGATPPMVKGLDPVKFGEEDEACTEVVMEFSEREQWAMSGALKSVGRIFQRIRDFIVGEYGVEKADLVVPSDQLDWIREDAIEVQPKPEEGSDFSEPHHNDGGDMDLKTLQQQMDQLQAQLSEQKNQFSELQQQHQTVVAERDALKGQLDTASREALRTECLAFAESLVDEGRLVPAQRDVAVGIMEQLAPVAELEFAEGVSKKPIEAFKDLLRTYPQQIEFGEVATKGKAGKTQSASEQLDALTVTRSREKNLAYNAAFAEICSENPDLVAEYEQEQ